MYKYDVLMNKYRLQIMFMEYVCLIDAIPKVWHELLKVNFVSKYIVLQLGLKKIHI